MTGDPFTYLAGRALRAGLGSVAGFCTGAAVGAVAGIIAGWNYKPPDPDHDPLASLDDDLVWVVPRPSGARLN